MAKGETIDADTFRQCLLLLGWSYADAARELRVHSRQRVADWAKARRPVPPQVAAHIAQRINKELTKRGV